MNEKNRRLGHSMKPRGTVETVLSTNEDSAEPENTPISDEEKGIESEVPLEAVLGEKQPETPKTAKNGENEQPAADFSFENDEVANGGVNRGYLDPQKGGETQPLEDLLKLSIRPSQVIGLSQGYTPESTVGEVFGGPVTIKAPQSLQNLESKRVVFNLADILGAEESDDPRDYAGIETTRMISKEEAQKILAHGGYTFGVDVGEGIDETVMRIYNDLTLGQQPDGSYKLVVAIPEGYIEGVKSQSELDNMTPEDWVSQKLAEYFEQWWFAPKQSR
jgi:hypothetical protein